MIDWLLRKPETPSIAIGDRTLPLVIRRNARSRRMVMRLAPDGSEVRLTVPRWCRTAEALSFARSGTGWLSGQLDALVERRPPGPGDAVLYRGRSLRIDWDAKHPRAPVILDETLRVGGPEAGLIGRIRRWLEAEALRLLEAELAEFCRIAGKPAAPLRLSRAQARWGSCSAKGEIRLNWRLIQAPDGVRRSVVAHEVAHLLHFDHSPDFHAAHERICDADLAEANRWLKRHGRSLYAAFG